MGYGRYGEPASGAPARHKRGIFLRLDQRKWPDVNCRKRGFLWENPPFGTCQIFFMHAKS